MFNSPVVYAHNILTTDCMSWFLNLCNIQLIWLCTSHSAIQPLACKPRVAQQLGGCACLSYGLRYELLKRHARRAQVLLHCIKMTQHSTQQANVRCFCVFCVLQQILPDAHIDIWCLVCPMTCLQVQQKVGPVNSACHICPVQVSVHKASLQVRNSKPSFQIDSGNAALCQLGMYAAKAWMHAVLHVAKQRLHQGTVRFAKTGRAVEKAFNS